MKKILGLTVAALMVMGLVGGGTWAYFSDTETSTGNSLLAGTLDLGLSNTTNTSSTGSITATFGTTGWAPGGTDDGTIYVNNDGSIAMTSVNITFSYGSVTDAALNTVTGWDGTADTDKLDKMIKATTATWDSVSVGAIADKTLEELKAAGSISLGSLAANTEKPLYILWTFDPTTTNGCQGDSVDLTITIVANQ